MALKTIRLELARNPEFPDGSREHGYEFVAPLDDRGTFDEQEWRRARMECTVRRFWEGEEDETGLLVRTRRGWAFHYHDRDPEEDEPLYHLDRHKMVVGDYVSITEHDGVQRTFKIVSVS